MQELHPGSCRENGTLERVRPHLVGRVEPSQEIFGAWWCRMKSKQEAV